MDIETGKQLVVQDDPNAFVPDNPYFVRVSPDFKYLAFFRKTVDGSVLRVVDAFGRDVATPSWHSGWLSVVGWLDASRLQISTSTDSAGTTEIYNPLTGATELRSPSFPDIYTLPPYPYWSGASGTAVFDHTLSRAAYFGYDGGHALFLWGIPEQEKLWRSQSVNVSLSPPAWSPDGSKIAFEVSPYGDPAPSGQLAIVDRNGVPLDILDFTAAESAHGIHLGPSFPSWSPAGDRVAFWITKYGLAMTQVEHSLAVLDLATRQVADYCLEGGNELPLWSPNGRFLAVSGAVLDTNEGLAYPIPLEGPILGWLAPSD